MGVLLSVEEEEGGNRYEAVRFGNVVGDCCNDRTKKTSQN